MLDAIQLAQQVVESGRAAAMEYVIAGETNLMEFRRAVERREAAAPVRGLQREARHPAPARPEPRAEGVQIFIGQESGYTDPRRLQRGDRALHARQEVVGVLGVIGPTRMAYERVIPIVDITARLLGFRLEFTSLIPISGGRLVSYRCASPVPRLCRRVPMTNRAHKDANAIHARHRRRVRPRGHLCTHRRPRGRAATTGLQRRWRMPRRRPRRTGTATACSRRARQCPQARRPRHRDRRTIRAREVRRRSCLASRTAWSWALAKQAIGGRAQPAGREQKATLRLLAKAFEKPGITEVDPVRASRSIRSCTRPWRCRIRRLHVPNTVLQVVQKGYQLNGRLLRPARVIVARAPAN